MIILVGSQKGGCGKSTLAVNIAAELARQSFDVVVVDADRQGTASRWAEDRAEKDLPPVHCVAKFDNVYAALKDMAERYQYVIVDAAGRDSKELRTSLLAADLLLTPFRPSQPDLDTMPRLMEIVTEARYINPNLKIKAALTLASANPFVHEAREAREILSENSEITLCKSVIRDRKAYRDSISEGLGVVEWKDQKAKAEIQLLVQELI